MPRHVVIQVRSGSASQINKAGERLAKLRAEMLDGSINPAGMTFTDWEPHLSGEAISRVVLR